MTVMHWTKTRLERSLGLVIRRNTVHGLDPINDIKRLGNGIKTILDVGANVGQSAIRFRDAFPNAEIDCFEPAVETFRVLSARVREKRCRCHNVGMGATPGTAIIHVGRNSLCSSVVDCSDATSQQSIEITTVDSFVDTHSITLIDLLKIDTEGFDIEVLKGAEGTIRRKAITFILVEVGFLGEVRHVPLPTMLEYLSAKDFAFVGLYDQHTSWSGKPQLHFANALFARRSPSHS